MTKLTLVCALLAAAAPNMGAEVEFKEEERSWWAFQPLLESGIPEVGNPRWGANPIDRFIYSALGERGLEPSEEAGREELVRRVYFDITGLPPSAAELAAFVEDSSPEAYGKLVDRLLESPRYGERWAQHWLDLVRYAESDGYRADGYRADAWPYRDYVIRSLNADKPYDAFVREQLAGDEIGPEDPDVMVATGYLRHGIYEYNQRDVREHWDGIVNEVTDVTGDVFLGLSFQCARCHDHKFDPILQADYYRLKSFFTPLSWRDDLELATVEEKAEYGRKKAEWEAATAEIRAEMEAIVKGPLDRKRKDALEKFPEDIQEMMLKPQSERSPLEEQLERLAHRQVVFEEERFDAKSIKGEEGERYAALAAELVAFDGLKPKALRPAFVVTDVGGEAQPTVFQGKRGEVEVGPGYLMILDPGEAEVTAPKELPSTGRRLALAKWITRPDNPLSTRVIVNRVWQMHFGQGLVGTPSDFGKLGEKPSHPELLDWLARRFVEDGWSLKKLHRRILTSETYRQTARREPGEKELMEDPQNRLLWKFSPRRLDAGQTRDALLHATGELNLKEGGASVGGSEPRRSVYLRKVRNTPDEFLRQFDGPAGFSSEPMRTVTTTPTQSLLLINGEWMVARAGAMAKTLLKEAGENTGAAVRDAYVRLYGRVPTPDEVAEGISFITEMEAHGASPPEVENQGPDPKLAESGAKFPKVVGAGSHAFPFDGSSGRLEVAAAVEETEQFKVEALIHLESLYPDASVRTLVSRWNGVAGGLSDEDRGWALGVTSEKSRYGPRNVIVQLVGEDFQGTRAYEVVASDLRVASGKPYYVAAVVSMLPTSGNQTGGAVTFFVQELGEKPGAMQVATVNHGIAKGIRSDRRKLVVGGRDDAGQSLFHGEVSRVLITAGVSEGKGDTPFSKAGGKEVLFELDGKGEVLPDGVRWMPKQGGVKPDALTAKQLAVADFCHVLMNSNEFLYLH